MKLTILGSGTVDPHAQRASSGYFLETSAGHLVFDMGNGVLRRAMEQKLPIHDIRTVVLSHLHPDHTADLVPFLFARKYATGSWSTAGDLTLYGPKGCKAFLAALFAAWPSLEPKAEGARLTVVELEQEEHTFLKQGEFRLTCVPVEHGDMLAFGFRFEDGEKCLAYSGDTKLCTGAFRVADGADLFICECSCFPRLCEPLYCREVHLSWEDVAEICEAAKPGALVLTHLYEPVLARRPNPLDNLQNALQIPVSLAEDGASYHL